MGLSEPKRRVKYSIDPNALNWANDESKFGKKLMERMGWQKGKGLGAREDGMTEHIKIKYKDDTKGVGFDNKGYENVWLDHQDGFEDLLSQLKKENGAGESNEADGAEKANGDETTVKSLEEKSKMSRARVHYRKFTRSKDLTNASANDLDCILGRQKRIKLKQIAEQVVDESSQESKKDEKDKPSEDESGKGSSSEAQAESTFRTINTSMSISDYFASKMAELKKRRLDESVGLEAEENGVVEENGEKKKKKKKKDEMEEVLVAEEPVVEESGAEKKKKKKAKKERQLIEEVEVSEEVVEVKVEENVEVPVDGTDEADGVEKKKKKKSKKEKKEQQEEEQNGAEHQNGDAEEVNGEESKEKKKKKKKSKAENEEQGDEKKETEAIHSSFKGSNVFQLNGYTPYPVTKDVEAILNEKYRKVDKKRSMLARKLAEDPSAYAMKKMPEVNLNTDK